MTAPNIVNVQTITGKVSPVSLTTTPSSVITNSTGSNTVLKVNSLLFSTTLSISTSVNVDIYRNSTAYPVSNNIALPASSTLVVLGKDTPIYLEEGDVLRAYANTSTTNAVYAIASYEIIS
jgi:hypothetical protein